MNFGGTLEHATLDSDYRDGATVDGVLITSADADRKSSSIYAGARLDVSGTVTVRAVSPSPSRSHGR